MDPARLVSPFRLSAARALVLLAAMAGLFAMHGLTGHGATHGGQQATLGAATALVAGEPHHEHTASDAPVPMVAAAEDATGTDDGQLPADMGLMGLCLAVLALAGSTFAGLLRAWGWSGDSLKTLPGQLALASAPLGTRDPPDRHRLQVHRC